MDRMKPVRLQRSRKKGFRLKSPNGLPIVYVGRGSNWGNPYNISEYRSRRQAIRLYERSITTERREEIRKILKGKNLACWCPLDQPCHADILLKIANNIAEVK